MQNVVSLCFIYILMQNVICPIVLLLFRHEMLYSICFIDTLTPNVVVPHVLFAFQCISLPSARLLIVCQAVCSSELYALF